MSFPNDPTGELLQLMQDEGIDLSQPYMLDFYVLFADEAKGQRAAERVQKEFEGCGLFLNHNEQSGDWELRLIKEMVPEHGPINAIETTLQALCKQYKGKVDGWGMLEPEDDDSDDGLD
ncbi:Regulator of ribonuclease activity B [Ferrimonas sediminum]|uniref:Regulator of ribonuclease activity B n=1 Tax=Ferrimonas sediminum TaxID=718193 RepID=A0A1G8UXD1_9GAMM|nr:ribonuclease E inhibitor RraB [Ferrimonas sediminum]SDJ58516.1 Regulator of ribonuclease activity B [Ferrimonas sediminum]